MIKKGHISISGLSIKEDDKKFENIQDAKNEHLNEYANFIRSELDQLIHMGYENFTDSIISYDDWEKNKKSIYIKILVLDAEDNDLNYFYDHYDIFYPKKCRKFLNYLVIQENNGNLYAIHKDVWYAYSDQSKKNYECIGNFN